MHPPAIAYAGHDGPAATTRAFHPLTNASAMRERTTQTSTLPKPQKSQGKRPSTPAQRSALHNHGGTAEESGQANTKRLNLDGARAANHFPAQSSTSECGEGEKRATDPSHGDTGGAPPKHPSRIRHAAITCPKTAQQDARILTNIGARPIMTDASLWLNPTKKLNDRSLCPRFSAGSRGRPARRVDGGATAG
jgi:hypothetical protein